LLSCPRPHSHHEVPWVTPSRLPCPVAARSGWPQCGAQPGSIQDPAPDRAGGGYQACGGRRVRPATSPAEARGACTHPVPRFGSPLPPSSVSYGVGVEGWTTGPLHTDALVCLPSCGLPAACPVYCAGGSWLCAACVCVVAVTVTVRRTRRPTTESWRPCSSQRMRPLSTLKSSSCWPRRAWTTYRWVSKLAADTLFTLLLTAFSLCAFRLLRSVLLQVVDCAPRVHVCVCHLCDGASIMLIPPTRACLSWPSIVC
jgi:hypothetical protein